MPFSSGRPRRRPFPLDCVIGSDGFILGYADKDTKDLVTAKPQDLSNVAPTDYTYSAQSPILETVASYGDLSLGYGLRMQEGKEDRRYYYALGVDCSVPSVWMKGPSVSTLTPTSAGSDPINRFFELGGTLYALNGRYCVQRVSDGSWTVAKDFGSGTSSMDAIVFHDNSSGGAQYAYVAMGDTVPVWRLGPTFEVQTVAISGTPTAGTWRIHWNGYTTDLLDYNASTSAVQSALRAIPGLSAITVTSTGTGVDLTHTVTFLGVTSDPPLMTVTDNTTGGAHAITVALVTAFVATAWSQRVEEQTITMGGTISSGTYTLTYGTATTANINWNDTASTVQTRLRALSGLASVTVTSTGNNPNFVFTVRFEGVNQNATTLTATNSLGGVTPTITIATSQLILTSRAWTITGREFWRSPATNTVSKVDTDADPWNEANWGAVNQFTIGDKGASITRMTATATQTLLIFKTDGAYTLTPDGEDVSLYQHLRLAPDSANGEALGSWLNDVYTSFRTGAYRITPSFELQEIGPERMASNTSPIKGRITAYCGDETRVLYAGMWNPDTGDSYLLKFGTWQPKDDGGQVRVDAWNGSITQAFSAKKISALFTSTIGSASNHTRLYLGFSDGTVGWFQLPCSYDPSACSSYLFSTTDGLLYLPSWHGGFQSDPKSLRAVTMMSLGFSATAYTSYQYKTDPGADWTSLAGTFATGQRVKIEFPPGTYATILDQKVVLTNTATSTSPLVRGLGLHNQLRTALFQVLEINVLAANGLLKRDNTPLRIGADRIRDRCKALASSYGSTPFTGPDELARDVTVIGYAETMAWNERLRQWQSAIRLQLAEAITSTTYGTYGRLEAYTYGGLELLTYGQMETV